jgi:N-acetylmuramate 1-kinase
MKTMSAELAAWLRSRTDNSVTAERIPGDVSGRDFWRAFSAGDSLILMDSGKIPIWPWLDIHELLSDNGFNVPSIMECDTKRGWVLLEDLGSLRLLDLDDDMYHKYLNDAIDVILSFQKKLDIRICTGSIAGRRSFTPAFFMAELENTLETLFFRLLEVPMDLLKELQSEMRKLCGSLSESTVFVHRDFHSANLMIHKDRLTIIDWQDSRFGPPAYDVVSLIRDSYRDTGEVWEDRAKKFIHAKGNMNMFQIARTACQRNLKAIGTFALQYRKTGDTRFLGYIPRTFRYLADYSRICPQLDDLVDGTYSILDKYSGEIDLRDFRFSNIPGVREK